MDSKSIIAALDAEIQKLKEARAVLGQVGESYGIGSQPDKVKKRRKKRKLSPEGRARIAEAQRKRWAVKKKIAK